MNKLLPTSPLLGLLHRPSSPGGQQLNIVHQFGLTVLALNKMNTVPNSKMRTITGTIKPTPIYWLTMLCDLEPPNIRRRGKLMKEFNK